MAKLLIALLFICISSFAAQPLNDGSSTSDPYKPFKAYCPEPNQLKLDPKAHHWIVNSFWKSHVQSFAKQIDQFLGAQWQGVQIGHIACVYSTKGSYNFFVSMVYSNLSYEPKTTLWGKNVHGHRNCKAHQVLKCPFIVVPKKKSQNPFSVLANAKQNAKASQLQPGAF